MEYVTLLAAIGNFFLGLLVFLKNYKKKINISFAVFSFVTAIWVLCNFYFTFQPSLLVSKLLYATGGVVIPLSFIWLMFLFNKKIKLYWSFVLGGVIGAFLLLPFIDGLIIKDLIFIDGRQEKVLGPLFYPYALSFLASFFFLFYILFRQFRHEKGIKKSQLKFITFGVSLFGGISIITSFILPLFGFVTVSAFDAQSSLFFVGFSAYAMVKHKLMDFRMVVARSVAFLLLLVSIAAMAGIVMMALPNFLFSPEILEKYNVPIRSSLGIILVFLFQPVRSFTARVTDKIFFKNEYQFHELLKKIADNAYSTLILIELLYKTVDIIIKEMRVERGLFVLLDETGEIHTTQAIGYTKTPEIKAKDVKAFAIHGLITLDDLPEGSHFKSLLRKADSAIAVGLVNNKVPVGVLFLGEKSSGDMYSAKDLDFFEILAPEMVVAIQRAEQHEKVQNFNVYLQAEIARKTKELQEANTHLRELDKAKDEFISMASHQLRTPLTAIKGYLSMLLEGDAGDLKMAQYDFVNEAFDGANRMVALINDLLNVSRMDTGRFFLEPIEVDLERMAKEEIKQLSTYAKDKALYLKLEVKNGLVKAIADETKIRQVMMNFIDNAIYYTMKGGVNVILSKEKENIVFKVEDTGMGVPEEQKKNLFQKFFRAENARVARPDGTGLGIYLARRVIEDHGGEIIFESEEGKGSTFGFKLPVKSRIKKEITIPPPDLRAKAEGIGSGEKKTSNFNS